MKIKLLTIGAIALFVSVDVYAADKVENNENYIPVEHAQKNGIKKCLPAIKKISKFLLEDGKYGAHDYWNKNTPNDGGFSATMERVYKDGSNILNFDVVHTKSGECFVSYEKIIFIKEKCAKALPRFKLKKKKATLVKSVLLYESENTSNYTMDTGQGCLIVRKEVIHNLK